MADSVQRYNYDEPTHSPSLLDEAGNPAPSGDYVKHADHLADKARAVKEAKIEGLREATKHECAGCNKDRPLFIEPETGRYTHNLGGNFCGADWYHKRIAELEA